MRMSLLIILMLCAPAMAAEDGPLSPDALRRHEGLVMPDREVALSPRIDGTLSELNVHEGDRVEKGQLLAVLDDRVQEHMVQASQVRVNDTSMVKSAGFALELAKLALERMETTFAKDAATDWEVRQARLARDQAQADLERMENQEALEAVSLQLEEARLDEHGIIAPFAGRVIRIKSEVGASHKQSDPILTLAALETLRAQVYLPAAAYGKLQLGKDYTLIAGEPIDKPLVGRLVNIDPLIDPASRTLRCVFEIDNTDLALPAGFTVVLGSVEPIPTSEMAGTE